MDRRTLLLNTAAFGFSATFLSRIARADSMADAQAIVDKYAQKVGTWDGPTTGPKAQDGKTIVVLAADMKNGGILGVTKGVEEAAAAIGWTVKTIDGAGSVAGRTAAFGQAMALNPSGIIINGFDAAGKPGCVFFTDSTYAIAIAKAKKMQEVIEKLGGITVEWVDTPIAETSQRMPQLTTTLLQKHGAAWTHSLAINDLYFDFMGPSLAAAGIEGTGRPTNVSAGDGSESAYQRIRAGQFQAATVAEPLNLQGWQLVDELNRAFAGEAWSGYVSPLHVVTKANVEFDGGPNNTFDPGNGYQNEYKKIWGKA